METITLYFRQGASDKVYQAAIEPQSNAYVVNFAYGRRGASLTAGTKTSQPVPLAQAKEIYNKLVSEKTAKGYTPGSDGTPYQGTEKASLSSGIHCQLLNALDAQELDWLIASPDWLMQEKYDGRRLLLRKEGTQITGINRLGLTVAIPTTLHQQAIQCPKDFIMDGEIVGETLHAFDLLQVGEKSIAGSSCYQRLSLLSDLLYAFPHPNIKEVETSITPVRKSMIFALLKQQMVEGVVFKNSNAPYVAGRPSSGGTQLKYKFCETASFIVGLVNPQRSVALLLHRGNDLIAAGNVTIPANHPVPSTGQIVECRYLYAFRESGCIFQPVYLGTRDDISNEDCRTDQLKYKASVLI